MSERSAVITPEDLPTLRVVVDDDSIEVQCVASEWACARERADFASWLDPVVGVVAEYAALARAMGQPELTPERMGAGLAGAARVLLVSGYLVKAERWRFHGGRLASPTPTKTWGPS